MISMTWKPDDGPKVALESPVGGMTRLGSGLPDIFFDTDQSRSTIIVANGRSKGPGTMIGKVLSGTLRIFDEHSPWAATPRHITLAFGCGHVTRLGEPSTYSPPREWMNRYLSQLPDDPAGVTHIQDRLDAMDFRYDDTPNINPEQSSTSEGRVCQALWAGSLCAAMGGRQDDVRIAAEEFNDFQMLRRHYFLYDENGKPLVAANEPWWRMGANGWDGQVKATFTSPESPYQFECITQHLAFDRLFEGAVGFNDYASRLLLACYLEAIHTRPQFRSGQTGNQQREAGYCMQLDAADKLSGLQTPERAEGGARALAGFRAACGFAPTGQPYAGFSPAKAGTWSHGYPSLVDWEVYSKAWKLELPPEIPPPVPGGTCDHMIPFLEQQAVNRGFDKQAFTFGKVGLWQDSTIVFMLGPCMEGLCDLRDCGQPPEGIDKTIQHVAACVTGPGREPGGIGSTGTTIAPNPVYDSYFSRAPGRVVPGPGKNGTTTWLINGLLRSMQSCGGNLRDACEEMAGGIWQHTDYPKPPDLQTTGPLPIAAFGIKA